MSNHGVDIEIAEMTSIVSSDYSRDDREDLKTTKKSRLEREMSNHGVDIEIAEMTSIVVSSDYTDDREDLKTKKKSRRKRNAIRVILTFMIATSTFLVLHLMSPMTVTRDGVTHAVIIFFIFMFISVILLTAFDFWWWNEIKCTPCLYVRRCSLYGFATFLIFFVILWIIRATNRTHLDDIHPLLSCELKNTLVARTQPVTIWIIPIQQGQGISEFPQWCAEMKALEDSGQAKLGMHGVRHFISPYEFECTSEHCFDNLTAAFLEGVTEWERAFNYTPHRFSAPGGFASADAVSVARNEFDFNVRTIIDGAFQRIYHCDDSFCTTPGGFLCTTDALNVF